MSQLSNNKKLLIAFGKHLQTIRKLKKISQEELAERASVHRTYIGMIERGERNPTFTMLNRIAHGLDITIDVLIKN